MDTKKAEGQQIRSFQYAVARLKARPELARVLIHKPGPLYDYPERADALAEVYRRGLAEVGRCCRASERGQVDRRHGCQTRRFSLPSRPLSNHAEILAECERTQTFTLAVTTTPRAWPRNNELASKTKYVRAALACIHSSSPNARMKFPSGKIICRNPDMSEKLASTPGRAFTDRSIYKSGFSNRCYAVAPRRATKSSRSIVSARSRRSSIC